MKKKVLILCTGNSCRSQMAEAIINHKVGGEWQAFSAGTAPAAEVHPLAVSALAEIGIVHHGVPKSINDFSDEPFDAVITVCDDAAENCPVWPGQGRRVHIGFPDPAEAVGTEEARMRVFRYIRGAIDREILGFLEQF